MWPAGFATFYIVFEDRSVAKVQRFNALSGQTIDKSAVNLHDVLQGITLCCLLHEIS